MYCKKIKLIDTWNRVLDNFQIVGVFYLCELEGNIKLSIEHSGYEWISIDEFFDVFTAITFTERMKKWNWENILGV